jgi:hypothetical protein
MGDAFAVVLGDMALKELLLNEVVEVFVGKVNVTRGLRVSA